MLASLFASLKTATQEREVEAVAEAFCQRVKEHPEERPQLINELVHTIEEGKRAAHGKLRKIPRDAFRKACDLELQGEHGQTIKKGLRVLTRLASDPENRTALLNYVQLLSDCLCFSYDRHSLYEPVLELLETIAQRGLPVNENFLVAQGSNPLVSALKIACSSSAETRGGEHLADRFKKLLIRILGDHDAPWAKMRFDTWFSLFHGDDLEIQTATAHLLAYLQLPFPPCFSPTHTLGRFLKSRHRELKRLIASLDPLIHEVLADREGSTKTAWLQRLLEAGQLPYRLRENATLRTLAFAQCELFIGCLDLEDSMSNLFEPDPVQKAAAKVLFTLIEGLQSVPEAERDAAKVERIKTALRAYLDREAAVGRDYLARLGLGIETLLFLLEDFLEADEGIAQRALSWLWTLGVIGRSKQHQTALAADPRVVDKLMHYLFHHAPTSIHAARVFGLLAEQHPKNQKYIGSIHLPDGVISRLLNAGFSQDPGLDGCLVEALITLASCPDNDPVLFDPHNIDRVVYALSDYVCYPSPVKSEVLITQALTTLARLMERPEARKAFFSSLGMPKRAIHSLAQGLRHSSPEVHLKAIDFLSQLAAGGESEQREVGFAVASILEEPSAFDRLIQASKSPDPELKEQAITLLDAVTCHVLEDCDRKGEGWQSSQLAKIFQGHHRIAEWDVSMRQKAFACASVLVDLLQHSTHWILDRPDVAVQSAAEEALSLLVEHEIEQGSSFETIAEFYNIGSALREYWKRTPRVPNASTPIAPATVAPALALPPQPSSARDEGEDEGEPLLTRSVISDIRACDDLQESPYLRWVRSAQQPPAPAPASALFWENLCRLGKDDDVGVSESKTGPQPDEETTPFLATEAASAGATADATANVTVDASTAALRILAPQLGTRVFGAVPLSEVRAEDLGLVFPEAPSHQLPTRVAEPAR